METGIRRGFRRVLLTVVGSVTESEERPSLFVVGLGGEEGPYGSVGNGEDAKRRNAKGRSRAHVFPIGAG